MGLDLHTADRTPRRRRATIFWISLALVGVTAGVYAPVRHYPFLNIDDPYYVTSDGDVTAGLTVHGIVRAFTAVRTGGWHPLTVVSHMLDCQLFGLNAGAHHLTNLVLHIVNTLLLLMVLTQMTGELWRSAFVAAVFAWHPLHVESVAWISARKDVLSGFFWMLTLWSYYRFTQRPSLPRYGWVLLPFALGLLAKPVVLMLPVILLLLDFWPLRRLQLVTARRGAAAPAGQRSFPGLLLEKLPLLLLGVGAGLMEVAAQWHGATRYEVPLSLRISTTFVVYATYIGKIFWPMHHMLFNLVEMSWPRWQVAGGAVVVIGVSLFAVRRVRRYPYLLVGWLWFLVILAPTSGPLGVGEFMIGDRLTYIPLVGLTIMVAWGIPDLLNRQRYGTAGCTVLAALAVAGCALLTSQHLRVWRDTMSFLKYQLEIQPDNYIVNSMIGGALFEEGRLDEAVPYLVNILRVRPMHAKANYYMGRVLAQRGDLKGATQHYRAALDVDPTDPETHVGLGLAFAAQGDDAGAAAQYREAIRLDPEDAAAHNNLAIVLEPLGQKDEAIVHYAEAVRLEPQRANSRCNLGAALIGAGRVPEAIEQFRVAVQLAPQFVPARVGLANAYAKIGETREAIRGLDDVLREHPDTTGAAVSLAWLLASTDDPQLRDGPRAVQVAEAAVARTGRQDADVLNSLAAAYAAVGRFADAVDTATQALAQAHASGRSALETTLSARREQYRLGRPVYQRAPTPVAATGGGASDARP